MPQSLCAVYIHLVFSTKERRALLTDSMRSDLHAYFGGILKERGSTPISINSVSDHVHLLFSLRQYIENQQAHHQKIDFREEFIWLCEKHGVTYDERYLWD